VVTGYLGFLAATSVWLASEETPADAPVLWRLRRPELSPQVFAWVVCLVAALLGAWAIVAADRRMSRRCWCSSPRRSRPTSTAGATSASTG
jgi:hypothetical protein